MLERLLPETRRRILCRLLLHPDEEFHLRELVRMLGSGRGAVERELRNLEAAGILRKSRKGNLVLYQAYTGCPVYRELHDLLVKTEGLRDVLLDCIDSLPGIELALVFGSAASGTEDRWSDVDLLLVGDSDYGAVSAALLPAQKILSRDISPTLYTPGEFRRRLREGQRFLRNVLEGQYILLKGSLDEAE